jgi:hypothetical protein
MTAFAKRSSNSWGRANNAAPHERRECAAVSSGDPWRGVGEPQPVTVQELLKTNRDVAFFLLSNGGPYESECVVYYEVEVSGRWEEPPGGRSVDRPSIPILPPATMTTFSLSPPGGTNSWRAAVNCARHYPNTDAGRRRLDFDWYVRKNAFIDTTYSQGISR